MTGTLASGVVFAILALACAALGLVLLGGGFGVGSSTRSRKWIACSLMSAAGLVNALWLAYALSEIGPWSDAPWFPHRPDVFAWYWVGNAVVVVVASLGLLGQWKGSKRPGSGQAPR